MDFMKVFDQTVREIKREVNLKVLKIPEIEQKVLDATDNEPWGPHGTVLTEIAQATKKYTDCQIVMSVLWSRLGETDKDWRYVYKALTVIEYLIANGSERALDEIIEHTYQISSLTAFEYVEPNGKDMGINVRKKAETIVALLNDSDKIQEVRNKAAATRDKYVGLSSRGVTYKSSSTSYSGSSPPRSNRYEGGFSERYDGDSYRQKYDDQCQEDDFEKYIPKSQRRDSSSERKPSNHSSMDKDVTCSASSKPSKQNELEMSYETAIVPVSTNIEDDDDFDPRGTTSNEPAASQEVDLFGESLIGDLGDSPTSIPTQRNAGNNNSYDVDLFGDADFISAPPQSKVEGNFQNQPNMDLFVTEAVAQTPDSTTMDFFAPVPLGNNFDGSDLLGGFACQPTQSDLLGGFACQPTLSSLQQTQNPLSNFTTDVKSTGKTSSQHKAFLKDETFHIKQNPVSNNVMRDSSISSFQECKAPSKKENTFQVKSGIWADSLSRGLIDLNITAPKKVNLAEIGILGELSDGSVQSKPKAVPGTSYIGTSQGIMWPTYNGNSSAYSTTNGEEFFSSGLSSNNNQYQFGEFQK